MRQKRVLAVFLLVCLLFTGCSVGGDSAAGQDSGKTDQKTETTVDIVTALSKIDSSTWNYNEEDGVYWQVGISYCENPADEKYETLGIFVPEAYMNGTDNGDGTYTCQLNAEGTVNDYTVESAPIVILVNTPGYAAMDAPTDYVSSSSDYTKAGFIYVNAGCRGRDAGAPAGVTDLKAAVRYIRYNEGSIPGSMERIFTFGMSGGGAQSALMGATGDSELYTPYLEAIGAVKGVSDAVAGSMCWCPITNLDYANEAYEWNMGITRTDLNDDTQALSDNMAEAFAKYINELELKDSEGNVLALTESEDGIYQAGSYYDYVKSEVERSLNNFLADTSFPYTAGSTGDGVMHGAGGRGNLGNGELPDKDDLDGTDEKFADKKREFKKDKNGATGGGYMDENGEMQDDGINRNTDRNANVENTNNTTYETAQDYIDSLNQDTTWVTYDSETNTATITSVEDFVKHCKNASKNVGAFDDLDATQGENTLFGYGDGEGAHFDSVMAELLKDNETYGDSYAADLKKTDALGNTVDYRVNMYNPMYYLSEYYDGYRTSNVAQYWRIRTGITQGDTALSTEINLTLALENYGRDVDFETVWGAGHTMAERTGNSTENFIEWVNECLK
jgi:hypothetical protein